MQTHLKKIPAFGRVIWDQVEDRLGDDVGSFRDWLTDKSIIVWDGRCFYFNVLSEQGYTVIKIEDLQFWINEWNRQGTSIKLGE